MNFSTGPVNISKEVRLALSQPSISHRSIGFQNLYRKTADFLCEKLNTKKAYFITGSGTAANEAMICQIKINGGKGLILSNGEFGTRLIEQANRASLEFAEYNLLFGTCFQTEAIEKRVKKDKIKWILFCHCETSTGVVNNLKEITNLCLRNDCLCFVDCMSTVGTHPIDLSSIAMATASSGKGLASIAGIAIVFSNIDVHLSANIPFYLDLANYANNGGVPFTISSNLFNALYVSINQKLEQKQFNLINNYSSMCFQLLNKINALPFNNIQSKVLTMHSNHLYESLYEEGIILSSESIYLKRRALYQMAFFGYYHEDELEKLVVALKKSVAAISLQSEY